MKRFTVALLCALLLPAACLAQATGQSTVNPNVPAANAPLQSSPMRANFAAAQSDINNAYSLFEGPTAPSSPLTGERWLNTSVTPDILEIWDGVNWVSMGTLDWQGHTFNAATGGVAAAVTSSQAINATSEMWPCNAASGPVTLTIPLGANNPNQKWDIKKVDSSANACTVQMSGSDTLDGYTSVSVINQNDNLTIKNSQGGSTWYLQ